MTDGVVVAQWVVVALTVLMLAVLVDYYRILARIRGRSEGRRCHPHLAARFLVEMMVNMAVPLPHWTSINIKASMIVFVRLYHVLRVIRNCSRVYRQRGAVRLHGRHSLQRREEYLERHGELPRHTQVGRRAMAAAIDGGSVGI